MIKKLFGITQDMQIRSHLQKINCHYNDLVERLDKLEKLWISLSTEEPSLSQWILTQTDEEWFPESSEFKKHYEYLTLWLTDKSTILNTPLFILESTLQYTVFAKYRSKKILTEYKNFLMFQEGILDYAI